MRTIDLIIAILQEHGGSMHYREIAAAAVKRGLPALKTSPADQVAQALCAHLKTHPDGPVYRTGWGEYGTKPSGFIKGSKRAKTGPTGVSPTSVVINRYARIRKAVEAATTLDAELTALLSELPDRDRAVCARAWGIGGERQCSHSRIARTYGVSRERVRQLVARHAERLVQFQVTMPKARAAMQVVEDAGRPMSSEQWQRASERQGLVASRRALRALCHLPASIQPMPIRWESRRQIVWGTDRSVNWPATRTLLAEYGRIAGRLQAKLSANGALSRRSVVRLSPFGGAHMLRQLARSRARRHGRPRRSHPTLIVRPPTIKEWFAEGKGMWWLRVAEPSRISNILVRLLHACGPLPVAECWAGVLGEMKRARFGIDDFRRMISTMPQLVISGETVSLASGSQGVPYRPSIAAVIERLKRRGGLTDSQDLYDALSAAGFDPDARRPEMTMCAAIVSAGYGFWALRGSPYAPSGLEPRLLRPHVRAHQKRVTQRRPNLVEIETLYVGQTSRGLLVVPRAHPIPDGMYRVKCGEAHGFSHVIEGNVAGWRGVARQAALASGDLVMFSIDTTERQIVIRQGGR